jgi:hypothetical protein
MVGRTGGVFDHREQVQERLRQAPAPLSECPAVGPSRWSLHTIRDTFPFLAQ